MVIKPSGVEYEVMTADDRWWLRIASSKVVEGSKKALFRHANASGALPSLAEIGGMVHTHSRHATIWSQAGLDLPLGALLTPIIFYGAIPARA